METVFILSALALGIVPPPAYAYPQGAPFGVCSSMTPGHGFQPQAAPSPFSVTASSSSYTGDSQITVTLNAPCGNTFKGFMLQARRVDSTQDPSETVGSFNTPIGSKSISCGFGQALTHTQNSQKSSMSFMWTAPPQSTGHLVFTATFVERTDSYWVKVNSTIIKDGNLESTSGSASGSYPSPLACAPENGPESTTKAHVMTSTDWWTTDAPATGNTMSPLVTQDSECGISKGCFSDCAYGKCTYLVTWAYQPQTNDVLFEIQASVKYEGNNQWMAIAFSDDMSVGNDSLTECVTYQHRLNVYSSYTMPNNGDNKRLNDTHFEVAPLGGSFVDGVSSCSFRRHIMSNRMYFFDLITERYMYFVTGMTQQHSDEKQLPNIIPLFTPRKFSAFGFETLFGPTAVYTYALNNATSTVGVFPVALIALTWILYRFLL